MIQLMAHSEAIGTVFGFTKEGADASGGVTDPVRPDPMAGRRVRSWLNRLNNLGCLCKVVAAKAFIIRRYLEAGA